LVEDVLVGVEDSGEVLLAVEGVAGRGVATLAAAGFLVKKLSILACLAGLFFAGFAILTH
jgi:hypothetical protein